MPDQMRIAVFTDLIFREVDGRLYTDRSFVSFLNRCAERVDLLVLVGRLDRDVKARHPVGETVTVARLPNYASISRPIAAVPGMLRAIGRFWRILDDVDLVWLWGPHPLSFPFALLARLRGRAVVLGARQHIVEYTQRRHPSRPALHLAARGLDFGHRMLARLFPIVVVGPPLAEHYSRARGLAELTVSLVEEADILPPAAAVAPAAGSELRVLSVGRLEAEKNPLLLADIAAALPDAFDGSRRDWRLIVCGEGPMAAELSARAAALGASERVELRGYVPHGPDLIDLYRGAHVFLHVSWTEALPQVLFEAFASATPVVATDVGGIRAAVGEAAVMVPPGDAEAAAAAVGRVVADADLRRRLVENGHSVARARTLDAEVALVLGFLHTTRQSRLP